MTLVIVILPLLIPGTVSTCKIVQHKGESLRSNYMLIVGGILISPFFPLLLLLKEVVISMNELPSSLPVVDRVIKFIKEMLMTFFTIPFIDNMLTAFATTVGNGPEDAAHNASVIQLIFVMLESLPQAIIQLYIITQTWDGLDGIDIWQGTSVAVSLLSLTFGIASNENVFENGTIVIKWVIFFFGLLTVISRILVCCLYSLNSNYLMILPISAELIVSIMVWLTLRLPEYLESCMWEKFIIFVTWLLTATYDTFTLPAIPASCVNLMFAIGCWFLPVPQSLAIAAITLAAFSFATNIILTAVPRFRHIFADQRLNRSILNLSSNEVEKKRFILKYSTVKDVYVHPIKSCDHEIEGWRREVYGASDLRKEKYEGVVFLGRIAYGVPGKIRWRVNWQGKSIVPTTITVSMPYTAYKDSKAKVNWHVDVGSKIIPGGEDGHLFLTEADLVFGSVRHKDIVAIVEGEEYHSARLFPQEETDKKHFPFLIDIHFKEELLQPVLEDVKSIS